MGCHVGTLRVKVFYYLIVFSRYGRTFIKRPKEKVIGDQIYFRVWTEKVFVVDID